MAAVLEIPLTARPQIFTINLGGNSYRWKLYWLKPAQCWVIDVADTNGNPIINGIPLVTGANLIGQFRYTVFNGRLIVHSDHEPGAVPDFTHLGITGHLFFQPGA